MIPLYALKLLHVVPANFIFNEKQPNKVRICLLGKKVGYGKIIWILCSDYYVVSLQLSDSRKNSVPLWTIGQDAKLVIRGPRVQAPPAAIVCKPRSATLKRTNFLSVLKGRIFYGPRQHCLKPLPK